MLDVCTVPEQEPMMALFSRPPGCRWIRLSPHLSCEQVFQCRLWNPKLMASPDCSQISASDHPVDHLATNA